MHATVTQLDRLLYDWLAEADERRFDLAFKRYYAQASTQLVRYLARRSSLPDLDCEQIAVDALLKFFARVGRERRQASASVGSALSRIEPLDLGPFHVRQVQRWIGEVGGFRQSSMSFTPDAAAGDFKSQIQVLADGIAPLQRQGCHLVDTVRTQVIGDSRTPDGDPQTHEDEAAPCPEYVVLREFAVALRDAAARHDAAQTPVGSADPESRERQLLRFVDGSWTVVEALPLLRVPTNGYLFDIAQSLYLDECKARGRRKRGGTGYAPGGAEELGTAGLSSMTPVYAMDESDWPEEGADGSRSSSSAIGVGGVLAEVAVDPASEHIDEDFCERFYEYLRKPLLDAEEAYHQAATRGRAEAERKRLESISRKNERLMLVLAMRIEGRTQEEIADALELSRNQVKYIVETVQSAYAQFCAAAARTLT